MLSSYKKQKTSQQKKKMRYEQKIQTKTEQKEESVNFLWRELEETEQEQTRGGNKVTSTVGIWYEPLGMVFRSRFGNIEFFDPLGLVTDGDSEHG